MTSTAVPTHDSSSLATPQSGVSVGDQLLNALLGTEPRQRVRLKRTLMAGVIYLTAALLRLWGAHAGWLPWHAALFVVTYESCGFWLIYAVVRSGFSNRFTDPALTLWQILLGLSALVLNYALIEVSRDVALPLLCLVLVFSMYSLTPTQILLAGGNAVAMLLVMLIIMIHLNPPGFDLQQQALNVALSAATLPVFAVVARRVTVMRLSMVSQRADMAQAIEQLNYLATRDGLTNLVNRRYMSTRLNEELQRMARSKRSFSVLLLDIDHFKRINDQYGHQVGDSVLISFARHLTQTFIEPDAASRWGGEEFLIVMPESTDADVQVAADRLQRRCEISLPARDDGRPAQVTFSGGIAQAQPDEPLQRLLERADAALYRAKHGGRNQIHIAP